MNMHCWANAFMNKLKKFYKTSDLAFAMVFLILLALAVATGIFCIKETMMCTLLSTSKEFLIISGTNLQWKSGEDAKFTFPVVLSGLREK